MSGSKRGRVGIAALWLLAWIMGLSGIFCSLLGFEFWLFLRLPGGSGFEPRSVEVRQGMNAAAIAGVLENSGVISDSLKFRLLCRLRRTAGKLKAGEYVLSPRNTPEQVLDLLISGKAIVHRFTFPEGSTLFEVAEILDQAGLIASSDLMKRATDREAATALLGMPVGSLEGFLFPETYHFLRTQDSMAILKIMVQEFWRHFPPEWKKRTEEMDLPLQDIVTMASLVEKEAVVDLERPIIAAVFYNRLKLGMPLQSDPTAVYDLAGFSGAIHAVHLKRESPYNTYLHKGLPIGPICNPGSKSIKAALYPDKVPFLYFVSNSDGTHCFSETLEEHNRAVDRYRERRRDHTAPSF